MRTTWTPTGEQSRARYPDDPEPQHPIWVRPLRERRLELPTGERRALITRIRGALGV